METTASVRPDVADASVGSAVEDADLGCGVDEQVVEVTAQGPAHVDGVVHDELLELLEGELAIGQRGAQVLASLLVDADHATAADADDTAVAPRQVPVAGPDL